MGRTWWMAPAFACAAGALIASRAGVSVAAFAPNVLGIVVGVALALTSRRLEGRVSLVAGIIASASIAATLLAPGASGVHRWLPIGPLALNVSTALLPFVVFAVASLADAGKTSGALLIALATQTVHVLQPDGGQAIAMGMACAVVAAVSHGPGPFAKALLLAVGVGGAWLAFTRPDRLPVVPHVEGIIEMARMLGVGWLALAWLALAVAAAPLVVTLLEECPAPLARTPAAALLACAVGAVIASRLGPYPVPLLGAGAGPVIGFYAALTLAQSASPSDRRDRQ